MLGAGLTFLALKMAGSRSRTADMPTSATAALACNDTSSMYQLLASEVVA